MDTLFSRVLALLLLLSGIVSGQMPTDRPQLPADGSAGKSSGPNYLAD